MDEKLPFLIKHLEDFKARSLEAWLSFSFHVHSYAAGERLGDLSIDTERHDFFDRLVQPDDAGVYLEEVEEDSEEA